MLTVGVVTELSLSDLEIYNNIELKSTPLNTLDCMLYRDMDLVKLVTAISLS